MTNFKTGALAFALAMTATTALSRPIGPDDIARLLRVGAPQVDAAGKWVAYPVSGTDVAADKGYSHIWMTSWDGARTVQLTGRAGESESSPKFSPDGHWLAFVSGRGAESGDAALWLMDRAGGEGRKLPGIKGSVSDYAWSPDSKWIALILDDPDPEGDAAASTTVTVTRPDGAAPSPAKPDGAVTAPATVATAKDKPPKPIVIDRFHFKQDRDGYLGKKRSRLWLYNVASGTATRLTTGDYDEALPAWSPDGGTIAFTSNHAADPDRSYDSNLFLVSVGPTASAPTQLTTFEGSDNWPEYGSYPAWSSDGKAIAYIQGGPVREIAYGVRSLAVIAASGGKPRLLTANLDRNVSDPKWSTDGRTIRFLEEDDEAQVVAEVPAAGGPVKTVAGGWRMFSGVSPAPGGGAAVLLSTPAAPTEVYALDALGSLRQLTHQNEAWLKEVEIAPTIRTSFKSRDGTEVHGFQVTPARSAKMAGPLPTMLFNHGGPQSQLAASFSMDWQIYAAHGLAVVAANFRGGTGRGGAYANAIYGKWGTVDVQDALAAVDDAVARGIADPKRLVVGGWSYGGILTNYVIASDKRFKAAVSGASISNVLAGYGTDQYALDYEIELGRPWEHPDVWMKLSYPFYQNARIVTPTLFMAGDKDFNVPLQNSEQMYQALKSRGVDTGLIIYPGQFHGLTRPSFLKDRAQRWLAWYDAHLPK